MPPLALHIALARDVTRTLKDDRLRRETGTYLLGSTTPDIRVLLRCDRSITHFFDIHNLGEQSSVENLFAANPHLRDVGKLNDPTIAFLSGYLTHLVMDEEWINRIYRPFFGADSALGGDEQANVMDRVLQYELDRRCRLDPEVVEEIRRDIAKAVTDVAVGFLEQETLERWRAVTLDIVSQPPDWERFRFVASRHLRGAGLESPEALDEFMQRIPDILQRTINHVSAERLGEFMEVSTRRATAIVREYLN